MNTYIVDSSVIVKWLNQTKEESVEQSDRIIDEAIEGNVELFTTELAKYEIGNVLIKKKLLFNEAKTSLVTLYSLPLTFVTLSQDLAEETYSLAEKFNMTYYDASFLSLAKQFGVPLITENVKHQGKSTKIKVIPL